MADCFEVTAHLPAKPDEVYRAWLDGDEHSAFTGGKAEVEPRVGGRFTAWDGYIEGRTLELEPPSGVPATAGARLRILQAWRTTEFPEGSPDSRLEVLLEKSRGGTRITLRHSDIPAGQGAEYQQGWEEHYFTPMKRYFAGKKGA
jgi:activator of HSP90 ATPase